MAAKLGADILSLADEETMSDLRKALGIDSVTSIAGTPKGMRTKFKIAEQFKINIRFLDLFKTHLGY